VSPAGRNILAGLHVILGKVTNSVLSDSVVVEKDAEVVDSILMPNVYIGKNAKIRKAIIGPNAKIMNGVEIGTESGAADFASNPFCTNGVSLVAPWVRIAGKTKLAPNSYVEHDIEHDGLESAFDFREIRYNCGDDDRYNDNGPTSFFDLAS
jgi:NDP-sugar pyrophosphorylase family protein